MSFFRQHGTAEAEPPKQERKVLDLVMSDGAFCLNDHLLTKVISTEAMTEEHEKEFAERLSLMNDHAAAQFFSQNPDL